MLIDFIVFILSIILILGSVLLAVIINESWHGTSSLIEDGIKKNKKREEVKK